MRQLQKKVNKASLLFNIIGDRLPDDVYRYLSSEEIEKLSGIINENGIPGIKEQNKFLSYFNSFLSDDANPNYAEKNRYKQSVQANIPESTVEYMDVLDDLCSKDKEELSRIIHGESSRIIALILFFANPAEVSSLIVELPDKLLEKVLYEIQKIDYHSERERDELERFLKFKFYLLQNQIPPAKIKDRKSKKMAEILSGLNPNASMNLFAKIRENDPRFAENIEEHYYSFQDILKMNRSTLANFLSGFHPIVLACALKGIETTAREKILSFLEPWLAKMVILENDSMGPVSLAEIEESQKGILHILAKEIEMGKIRLWKGELYGKTGI